MSQPLAETAIEVVADTEPFEDDVERLGKRTRRRKIEQPVKADTRTMLREIEQALDTLRGADVEVDPDTARLIKALDTALDGYSGDVNLDPNVAQLAAQVDAALAGLDIEVPITPKVDGARLRDARGRFIKAGASLGDDAGKSFDRAFGKKVKDAADESSRSMAGLAGKIGAPFVKGAAAAVALGSALSGVSSIAASLGPVLAAGLAFLPAYIAARVVALGAFKLAVAGVGDALSAAAEGDAAAFAESLEKLSPAAREFATAARDAFTELKPLQQALQEATFAGLKDEIDEIGRDFQSLGPYLTSVGQGFNAVAAEALNFASTDSAIGLIMDTLTGLRGALDGVLPAIRPILDGFASLGSQGAAYLPGLGEALGRLGEQFGTFLQGVDLGAVIEAAMPTLRALGELFSNIGSIASSVFAASGAEGAGLLGVLADLTGVLADFLNTAGGLEALKALMGAAAQVGEALGGALGAVLPALAQAIAPIAAAIGPLAQALGQVLAAVAPLLPPIGQLIAILGGALTAAIQPLIPIVGQLATIIGSVLAGAAPVLEQLGSTIAAILAPAAALIGELFAALAPHIQTVVGLFASALAPLLAQIAPLFVTLFEALSPLIPALVSLLPPIVEIVIALTPMYALMGQLLTAVVKLVAPIARLAAEFIALLASEAIAPILSAIASAITYLIGPLSSVVGWISQFATWLTSIDWGAVGSAIGGAFSAAWDAVVSAVEGIVAFVMALPGRILSALAALPGMVVALLRRMGSLALQAVGVAIGLILYAFLELPGQIGRALAALPGLVRNLFARALSAARSAAVSGFNAVVSFVQSVPGRIGTALSRLGSIISGAWSRAMTAGRNAASRGLNSIVDLVRNAPARITALAGRFVSAGGRLVSSLVNGLKRVPSLGSIGSSIAGVIKSQLNRIVGAINRGIANVDDVLPGSLPRIPTFARGAVVDRATLGVFGEAGPEVIIPLSKPARARQLAAESGLDRILTGGRDAAPVYVSMRAYIGTTEITSMIRYEVDSALDDVAAQVDAGVRAF